MDVIVVGVDGSAHSVVALRYALREAKAHDYVVRAVAAWHVPTLVYGGAGLIPTTGLAGDYRAAAEARLDEALAAVAGEADAVTVQRLLREGDPGRILVAESEQAQLLVVGSRGLGNISGLLLGSVSHHCCQHAHCPVVVIPHAAH